MAAFSSRQNWFFRYKIYHIPFWVLYSYLLWSVETGSFSEAAHEYFFSIIAVKCFFYVLFPAFAVYFNLYFLVPHYLQKGRYGWYMLFLALTIVASSFLIVPGYFLCAWLAGSDAQKMWGLTWSLHSFYNTARAEPLKNTIAAITLGMSIKLAKNWIETQRRHQALEKEKLETELKFLKYQFNPHFLFNSINSIFFLIHKNPNMASASLAKFSELLRHQLYECNDQQIALDKEIAYLNNFIELEKLRQNENLTVSVNMEPAVSPDMGIAPFILMTFVENAFKHVSRDKDRAGWININLSANGTQLHFSVGNSASLNAAAEVINYGGIGLTNVKRRLELIYPGEYQLDIRQDAESFVIKLQLQLSQLETTSSLPLIADLHD
ncbi:MAG TPA: histidine kinase [Mucilaginibacter sp.]|jgi:sensor histidine kinase YesM